MRINSPGDPDFELATKINELHMEAMKKGWPIDICKVAGLIRNLRIEGMKAQREAEDLLEKPADPVEPR